VPTEGVEASQAIARHCIKMRRRPVNRGESIALPVGPHFADNAGLRAESSESRQKSVRNPSGCLRGGAGGEWWLSGSDGRMDFGTENFWQKGRASMEQYLSIGSAAVTSSHALENRHDSRRAGDGRLCGGGRLLWIYFPGGGGETQGFGWVGRLGLDDNTVTFGGKVPDRRRVRTMTSRIYPTSRISGVS
jgi:hypothetical protein